MCTFVHVLLGVGLRYGPTCGKGLRLFGLFLDVAGFLSVRGSGPGGFVTERKRDKTCNVHSPDFSSGDVKLAVVYTTFGNEITPARVRPVCGTNGVRALVRLRAIPPTSRLFKIATWLILPVVICLSQRLSHACLSIALYCETANGSINQL